MMHTGASVQHGTVRDYEHCTVYGCRTSLKQGSGSSSVRTVTSRVTLEGAL